MLRTPPIVTRTEPLFPYPRTLLSLGRTGKHAALDPLKQPVGLIAGKIRREAQAARAGLLAQRLGLVALGIVVGESRVLVLVHIAPFRRWISGPFKRLHRIAMSV